MASPGDDIESILKAEGLDIDSWVPIFKQKRITSRAALQHVIGDDKFYVLLEKSAEFDWEKRALRKLLNIEEKESKKSWFSVIAEKFKFDRKAEKDAQLTSNNEASHCEASHDEISSLESEEMNQTIKVDDQDNRKHPTSSNSSVSGEEPTKNSKIQTHQFVEDSHIKCMSTVLATASYSDDPDNKRHSTSSNSSFVSAEEPIEDSHQFVEDSNIKHVPTLLVTASHGQALRGVLLTENLEDYLVERSFLLQMPKDISLRPTYQSQDVVKHFCLKRKEDEYKRAVGILGLQVTIPGRYHICDKTGASRDVTPCQADAGLSVEMYSSVVKHSTVQVATYYFRETDLLLSDEALIELKNLKSLFNSKEGANFQSECEIFFKKFGSHVSRGPIHFGGVCWWTCSSGGFRCREREGIKRLQYQAISGLSTNNIDFCEKGDFDNIKQHFGRICSSNTLANTRIEVNLNGGPTEARDFKTWKDNLAKADTTWIITDPGNRYIAIWDIIAINYAEELGEIMNTLCEAWEKMTNMSNERTKLPSFESDTVLELISNWSKSTDKTSQATVQSLKYLIEVKSDLILSTGSPDEWTEKYLRQPPLQQFIQSVATFVQDKVTNSRYIRFLMQQLIDPLDLQQLTSITFNNKGQISEWLHKDNAACMLSETKDIRVLEECLQNIIEEMEIVKIGKDLLVRKSTEQNEMSGIINSDTKVAKAIFSFQSQHRNSLEGVLIIILIHPFISDSSKEPIELHPMSLDDLKFLHKQFKEHWKKFAFYKNQGNSLQIQAYLLHLAASIYNIQKGKKFQEIRLKRLLACIKDHLCMFCQLSPPIAQLLGEYLTNICQLVQFREQAEIMIKTGVPSAPSCKNHSLQHALLTVSHHEVMLQEDRKSTFERNEKIYHLFQELDLCDYYPKKLSMEDALRIKPDVLRMSLNKNPITHSSQLVKLILHKIMAYDHLCRSDLMHAHKDRSLKIHPVDSLLAILVCSDDFLKQDLMSRLAKCQLAIPFILPDPFTQQLMLPLWAMRSIVKEWRIIEEGGNVVERAGPILCYKTPIVSFIRLGKRQRRGASKSKIMNEVISESHYDHFFDRDCAGGHFELLMGEGLIDMCWYLPAAKPDDAFPVAVTFLNLHGDARYFPQRCKILSAISSICFVLLTEEENVFNQQCCDLLKPFASSLGGVILLNDADESPEILHNALSNSEIVDLQSMNAHDMKMLIRNIIIERVPIYSTEHFKSLEEHTHEILSLNLDEFYVDEDNDNFRKGKKEADKLIKLASEGESGYLGAKQAILPLQGQDMWQAWAKKDKEAHRQVQRGKCTINEYTDKMESEKKKIRDKQLQHVSKLTPVMESFVTSTLSLGGILNSTTRNFFLQCLKIGLNDLCRASISELQVKYVAIRQALHKTQAKINSTESDTETEIPPEDIEELDRLKNELSKLHTELINASFGLEHLLRELGQLYETAVAQELSDPCFMEQISRLPEAAAELLIDGYPLEVMDGDAAHVPIRWIKAVLEEVVRILDDPKVYVMSVLGLQSTGKSTMLNTTFGLHFNVSAGRCTRGAFMQLIPVSEEMRLITSCAYILVVDTEGLRAPELDSQQTQKHDNELSTFVIGLANVTLINIYGEVPGDMDDILQTSVHAFLRMNEVRYTPSCQFVHQNAGANVSSEMGRANFTTKLNNMTLDAAKAEKCAEQYKTFADVIQFDDLRDVHHFPGLWKGDPPMAPVNHGYSERAQGLKYHIVNLLEAGARIDDLSLFEAKIGDLWDALLTEKFVFSFKNTLEITAYNSLEAHYNACDWKFQKFMLEWEQRAENDINAAKPEEVAQVMIHKKKDTEACVHKKYEELKQDMDDFFEVSKQSDTLIQWKAKFELKLEALSEELKLHAQDHCERIGTGRQANSKFEEEKKEYEAQMTEMVEDIIQQTKQEQELLNDNLERGKLDQEQVQKILKDGLFEITKLEQYKKQKIISESQLDQLNAICPSQHGSSRRLLNDVQLRKMLEAQPRILSLQEIRTILKQGELTPEQLKDSFDEKWSQLVKRLPPVHDSGINVEEAVEEMLIKFVGKEEGMLIKQLQREKSYSLRKWGSHDPLEVTEEHFSKIRGSVMGEIADAMLAIGRKIVRITDPRKREAQSITNELFELAIKYLEDKIHEKTDFNKVYTSELLHKLEEKINQRSAKFSSYFVFTQRYRIDVFLRVCGYAVGRFEEMAEAFRERNNPRVYLERKLKEPLFTKFKAQYYRTAKEEAIACILCAHLAEPIKTQVERSLGTQVVEEMKMTELGGYCFNNKATLNARILIDLGDDLMAKGGRQRDEKPNSNKSQISRDDLDDYFCFIVNKKNSLKNWLHKYTIQFCDNNTGREDQTCTHLQRIAKEEVNQLILLIKNKVDGINVTDANEWLKIFCEDKDLTSELGIKLDSSALTVEGMKELNLDTFTEQIRCALYELKEKVQIQFSGITCKSSMQTWKDNPVDILMKLICGCTEQCPFCKEQCDHGLHDEGIKHVVTQHRPQCLGGYRDDVTEVMALELCPAVVASDNMTFQNNKTNHEFVRFSEYESIYPAWSITPDATAKDSFYWKWFIGNFHKEIADFIDAKDADIPDGWKQMKWENIKKDLKKLYKL
jgi:hypothetical protein